MATTSDYLKLHFIVFMWGSTAIVAKLISIPAVEMVFYRVLIAALGMAALILFRKETFKVSLKDFLLLIALGILVGAHWIAFFVSGQISTASVSLVGFATCSLWTAIIEPLSNKKKIKPLEIGLGLSVLVGLYVIFSFDFKFYWGLSLGILSGFLLAILSVFNSHLVRRVSSTTITFYEMVGGFIFCAAFLPIYQNYWAINHELILNPTLKDWIYITLLALACTVYAYSVTIELMKRLSVFVIQLSLNLEPVYGIMMAVLLLNEGKFLNLSFCIGTLIILASVACYPLLKRRFDS